MKKTIFFVTIIIFIISCGTNKKVFEQKECNECPVLISFFLGKEKKIKGNLVLKKKLIIRNSSLNSMKVIINYFNRDSLLNEYSTSSFRLIGGEFRRVEDNNELDIISIYPMKEEVIFYEIWNNINYFNPVDSIYKGLDQYLPFAKPLTIENHMGNQTNPNILIYEEPFSEFKRKNPELLEFLTKGDTIELEVISPVKQKYRFKAEW